MKKVLIPLSLTVALAAPLVFAARWESAPDAGLRDLRPFQGSEISPARDTAVLDGFARNGAYRTLVVGAAIPGNKAATCAVRVVAMDGSVIEEAVLDIQGGTNAQFDFADRIDSRKASPAVAAAKVSCDQSFHPYAAAAGVTDPKVTWGEFRGPSGACDFTVQAVELDPGVFTAAQTGTIHNAAAGNEKGIVCIKAPRDLALDKMTVEWDVNVGPWHKKTPHGNHAMIWMHRGRFRSGSIVNVNAFGPKKSFVKMNQNVDLSAGGNTNTKMGIALQPGRQYHLRNTYDAANKRSFTELFEDGALLKKMEITATARNRTLLLPVFGYSEKGSLFAEFGHNRGQHFPELPSYGWRYSNLRVEMHVKK